MIAKTPIIPTKTQLAFWISLVFTLIFIPSCNTFDREEPIPAYLFIDNFTLDTKSDNSQGSNAHDILDAWVYVDGILLGAYEVPVTIPVLNVDTARITVLAGVKKNGLSNNRIIYPYYKGIQDTMILVPGRVDSIFPVVTYHDSTTFALIEDFEDRTISFEPSRDSSVTEDSMRLTFDPSEVYNHNNLNLVSGYVQFDSVGQLFENATISRFTIPTNSSTYLEINYNLETETQIGFYAYDASGAIIDRIEVLYLFKTKGEWKKSYISLNEDMSNPRFAGASFKLFVYARNNSDNPNARIYLDNLKLLHF